MELLQIAGAEHLDYTLSLLMPLTTFFFLTVRQLKLRARGMYYVHALKLRAAYLFNIPHKVYFNILGPAHLLNLIIFSQTIQNPLFMIPLVLLPQNPGCAFILICVIHNSALVAAPADRVIKSVLIGLCKFIVDQGLILLLP
jgi:hypothetical protein